MNIKISYKGHTIEGPDPTFLGYYVIAGPNVQGGSPTLSGAKSMVRESIKQRKCRDVAPGHEMVRDHVNKGRGRCAKCGYYGGMPKVTA